MNKAVILRTKKPTLRKDGSSIRFMENAALVLNQQGQPVGTRILGIIPKELKSHKGARITSLAAEFYNKQNMSLNKKSIYEQSFSRDMLLRTNKRNCYKYTKYQVR